ncbi:MAG: ABC transporter substrate-binding protein [Syntrophothermus sp.]
MSVKAKKLLIFMVAVGLIVTSLTVYAASKKVEVKPEDSIIRVTEDWPTYIDPAVGSDFSDSIALVNLYDSLVFPQPDGTVKPQLATGWTVSPDGKTYTFNIRKGVKFHNGDELKASDVEFSLQRMLKIGEGYGYLFTSTVASVKATGDYKLEIKLKEPFGPFILSLVRLYVVNKKQVMEHIEKNGQYGEMGDYGKKWLLTHDAGSGPYKVKEMKMEEYLLAEKFDNFWKGWDPQAPRYFKESGSVEPVTVRTLVSRRELEITDELQPLENYDTMAKIPGIKIATFFNGHNLNMMLNTKKPPTDDIHFRKALSYILDYNTITTRIYPGSKPARGPVPFNLPGFDNTIKGYTRDVAKAREELAKSRYADKLDQYPVELTWCAEAPEEEKIALLFQANAAEIGIKVNITKKPFGSMIADAQKMETTPNASVVFVAPHYAEAGSMLSTRYHSSSAGTWEQMEWLQDKEIDKMIEDALATVDQAQRFAKYAKIQKKIVELAPTIWLFDQAERRAYQANYIVWPTAERASTGKIFTSVMGYDQYAHDMKVYPEKRAGLLQK